MKIPRTLAPILSITLVLVVVPLLILTTPIGHFYLRYFVNYLVPNRQLQSRLAKSYVDNPAQFEDVAKRLTEEPFPDLMISKFTDKGIQVTNLQFNPTAVKPETKDACIKLMEQLKLITIIKQGSKISFNTSMGVTDSDNSGLVYSTTPEVTKSKGYLSLNEHWSISAH